MAVKMFSMYACVSPCIQGLTKKNTLSSRQYKHKALCGLMHNIQKVTCSACLDVATFNKPTHCLFMCLGLHKVIHRYLGWHHHHHQHDHHRVLKKQVVERAFMSVGSR